MGAAPDDPISKLADFMQDDPISKLATAAVTLHEMYTSLCKAGFSDAQAMELVKAVLLKGR